MQRYELTVVIDGKATPAKKKALGEKVNKLVKTLGGRVTENSDWGVKDLAYRVKKSTTGFFAHYKLELETQAAKGLSNKLRLEEEIIRSLLIRV